MITPTIVSTEHTIPVKVVVSYTDDLDDEKSDSSSISLLLRPKTFLEITNDGGIWVGDFFIAPYVSIGTIVGIPAGTIFSLLLQIILASLAENKSAFQWIIRINPKCILPSNMGISAYFWNHSIIGT